MRATQVAPLRFLLLHSVIARFMWATHFSFSLKKMGRRPDKPGDDVFF
jgi:hypothetical protein